MSITVKPGDIVLVRGGNYSFQQAVRRFVATGKTTATRIYVTRLAGDTGYVPGGKTPWCNRSDVIAAGLTEQQADEITTILEALKARRHEIDRAARDAREEAHDDAWRKIKAVVPSAQGAP